MPPLADSGRPARVQAHARDLATVLRGRRVVVLSGAGCSTPSGIPDYRGPTGRRRRRTPVTHDVFVADPKARRRYWARAVAGWPRFRSARPNAAHRALARLEAAGLVSAVVTQNVDGLHRVAGSRNVVELHGSLHRVVCLSCRTAFDRDTVQRWFLHRNPGWARLAARAAPDGDADLPEPDLARFRMVDCPACGGILKPDVVFFGAAVPRPTVERVRALVAEADVLWVVGSSLAVFSGYRFVRQAHAQGTCVAIANLGPTRADDLAHLRIEADVADLLPAVADLLVPQPAASPA